MHAQLAQWRAIVDEKEHRASQQAAAAAKLESELRVQQAKHEAALAELKLRHDTVSESGRGK